MTSLHEYACVRTPLPTAPKGWEPYTETKGDTGRAVVSLAQPGARESELLREAGFDPAEYVVSGDVSYRKWMRHDQEWLHYYRFDVRRRTEENPEERAADLTEIVATILGDAPPATWATRGPQAFVVVLSDWQIGKNTTHTVEGVRRAVSHAKVWLQQLREDGHEIDTIALLATGDLFEGCQGHYEMQPFTVDLDRRGQTKVVRRLVTWIVRELAPLCRHLLLAGVGGNHGENRRDGKAFTTFADNDDVAVLEAVQEIFGDRDGYRHVEFYIADDELAACIDIKGVPIGITHGHLASRGGTMPQAKQKQWWGEQWWDENAAAPRAKILVTSHYHHLTVSNYGSRTHIQSPAFDGGSAWFAQQTGMASPDGLLTFVVDPAHPLGWDNLRVL